MFDIKNLPTDPGCYLFKDKSGRIIYVGKAKNLRKRVKSYVQKNDLDAKTQSLIKHVESVEYIATDNEVEAFVLENTLVKKYQPKYNIDLKDAKSYAFIQLTDEEFPRVLLARKKTGKGKFYGPFVSAQERDYILHFLRKTFALKTCKKLPKKPCLRHHINLCDAPCAGLINKEDYNKKIAKVKLVLSGNAKKLLKQMQKEMKNHSEESQFEWALKIRDEIAAIGKAPNVTVGSTYYSQLAEQGNSELMKRLNTELISNLEISSKRQRELTWAIVIIGGANLVLAILKLSNIIKV